MFCANLFYAHVRHERHLNSTLGWAPNPLAGGSNQIHPQPKAFFSSDVLKCAAWWWCLGLKLATGEDGRHWYSGPLWFLCTVPSHYSAYLALIQSTVMRYIYIYTMWFLELYRIGMYWIHNGRGRKHSCFDDMKGKTGNSFCSEMTLFGSWLSDIYSFLSLVLIIYWSVWWKVLSNAYA